MNILIVTQYFWPENFRINGLAVSMKERGHQVTVLTGLPNYPGGKIHEGYATFKNMRQDYKGITVYRVPIVPRGSKGAFQLFFNYTSFIVSGLLNGPWLLRGCRFDSIFVYGVSPILQAIPALFLGWLKECSVTVYIQDLWPESLEATGYVRNPHILALVRRMVRFIYSHTDLLLVQSHAFIASVESLVPGKRVAYLPNSVDKSFCVSSSVLVPNIPGLESGFSVMFAGNVGTGQAMEAIVDAASLLKNHPDINFVILGQGSRWEWMCQEVKARGLSNLHLPGSFPFETMPHFMKKASVLLVSLADEPCFSMTIPSKLQAYMASGRPILAFLNGEGARIVTEAKAGLAVPAEDAKALSDAVLRLHAMTAEERKNLGSNGYLYYNEHFEHDRLVDQLIGHLQSVRES